MDVTTWPLEPAHGLPGHPVAQSIVDRWNSAERKLWVVAFGERLAFHQLNRLRGDPEVPALWASDPDFVDDARSVAATIMRALTQCEPGLVCPVWHPAAISPEAIGKPHVRAVVIPREVAAEKQAARREHALIACALERATATRQHGTASPWPAWADEADRSEIDRSPLTRPDTPARARQRFANEARRPLPGSTRVVR